MSHLTVCAAGAGSGKTYSICERITEAILGGTDPASILATTFRTTAASDLKHRIQARILSEKRLPFHERVALAERLELAFVGTVDSVAHKLLRRYALEGGMSPRLEVLDEETEQRALVRILQEMDPEPWQTLASIGRKFGDKDAQKTALDLLHLKRGNRISNADFAAQMAASAKRTSEVISPTGPNPHAPNPNELYDRVKATLATLETIPDTTGTTAKAKAKLAAFIRMRTGEWHEFTSCTKLEASKKSGADAALEPLRAFAGQVRQMRAIHDDVHAFLNLLATQTLELSNAYDAYKEARGMLDFTDLEAKLLDLLERPDVADDLRESISLVVVDEFQDTNPIQLAIFLRLRDLAAESYWVGDEKQAIYGFRGSDADLMQAVWSRVPPAHRQKLPASYRSQAGLVHAANRIFEEVFPGCSLKPTRPEEPVAIERWLISAKNIPLEHGILAGGVSNLIEEGTRERDIAVLTRTNQEAKDIATALKQRGIRATVDLPGLLATRECVVALAGLGVVADGWDTHAAATLLHHLEEAKPETPEWIIDRLTQRQADPRATPWAGHPIIEQLRAIDATALSPADALAAVIHALDLPSQVTRWGDSARRHVHLDALLRLASKFAEDARASRRAATVAGLIAWLNKLERDKLDTVPTPAGLDAVTVTTYHGSKGLEWPVVILASLKTPKAPDPWEPRVEGGAIEQDAPLQDRYIRYWPWPFLTGGPFSTKTKVTGLLEDSLATPEGISLIAKEEAESLRLLYVGFTRARSRVILSHRDEADAEKRLPHYAWLHRIPRVDDALQNAFTEGTYPLTDGSNLRVREMSMAPEIIEGETAHAAWVHAPTSTGVTHAPRIVQPSQRQGTIASAKLHAVTLPGTGTLPPIRGREVDALGDAIHAYFATLPSTNALDDNARRAIAARCITAHRVSGALDIEALVHAGERLRAWVKAEHPDATWHTEVNITAPLDGSQGVGTIDMLLVDADGATTLVDHKSVGGGTADAAEKARAFTAQIEAYVQLLKECGAPTPSANVHLPYAGAMVVIE